MIAKIVTFKSRDRPSRLVCIRSAVTAAAKKVADSQREPGFLGGSNMNFVLLALSAAVALLEEEVNETEGDDDAAS